MNLGKNQLIKKQTEVEFIAFAKSLRIHSNTHHPALHKLTENLQNYLSTPFEDTIQINNIFDSFDFSNQIPKTKSRLCGGILKKGDRAYKCHECLNEDNSILCMQCFDFEKHKDHQFELIQIHGGCCDCGDPQKWNKEGFCKEHSSNQISDIIIDSSILEDFLYTHKFSFSLLLYFYQSFIQKYNQIKDKSDYSLLDFNQKDIKILLDGFKKKAVAFVEKFGCLFVNKLIAFNKNGQYANKMTNEFLKAVIDFNQYAFLKDMKGKSLYEEKNILSLFFLFIQFNKLPDGICDLFITLFQLRGFREILTVQYIQQYHKSPYFLVSNYTHLSSQLFTSYITISQIVLDKKIKPLSVNFKVLKEEDVQIASQCYIRFYYDIGYLSKLYGDASIDYFRFHAANHAMNGLCDYRNIFNPYPSSIDYYGLDEIFIIRMFQTIKIIQRDQSKFIFKITLRDLYKEITSSEIRSDNYYRPHQRLFALLTFAYFEGDLQQLDNEENMIQFLATICSDNLEYELKMIIRRLCTIFSFAASLLENQKRTSDYYTFYSFYFKKTSNLFNLDSILMKITLKMCEFCNEHASEVINFRKMIQNGDAFFDVYNKMMNFSINRSTLNTERQIGQSLDILRPQHFKHFIFYLSLINEAITSDLPILAISCALQPKEDDAKKYKIPELRYAEQAEHYYRNILKSCQNSRISVKDFKTICDSFFIEEELFKSFVTAHQDDSDKRRLNAQKCKGFKMSPIFYKSIHLKIFGIDHHGDMGILPFYSKQLSKNIFSQNYEVIWKSAQAYINLSQKAHQNENEGSSKSIISNLFNMVFTFLWTIYVQNKDNRILALLREQIKKYKLQQALPYLFKQIEKQASCTFSIQKNEQSQENQSKQQKKREKMLNKKQLLNQKMLKNKNAYLPIQSVSVEESQYLCCICKQQKASQPICYVAFSTITNYHGWLDLHQSNQFFLFSTCGHMIHRSCKEVSQKGGKVYNFCHLCKKPTNIIIPKNSDKISFSQAEQLVGDLLDIIKIFGHQCSISNLLFRSLIGFLVFKGILFPQYFVKEINIYSSIFALLKNYYQLQDTYYLKQMIANEECFIFKNSSNVYLAKEIFYQFSNILLKFCNDQSLDMIEKKDSEISETAVYLVKNMIQAELNTEKFIDIQFPLRSKFGNPISYKQLPLTLGQFSRNYLGKCQNCGLVTNLQAICLICPSFITCVKCEQMGLNFHSQSQHLKTCSFVKTNSGEIIYIYKNRHWIFESIYEDYMGRPYKIGQNNKQGFQLNKKKLNQYFEDIITCNIETKLRSKEKECNKVYNDAAL